MLTARRSADRGHADHGWLVTHHTFSFADYHDSRHMGFRSLRVLNEDAVAPGQGFGKHPHRDMEILTWVIEGALAHEDSLGTGAVIRPGEIQRMSAGTGVLHSELNPSATESVHLVQIWIVPERRGLPPGYEQRHFPESARRGRLCLLAARDGRDGAVTIHQDASLATALLAPAESVAHVLAPGRGAWLQVTRGEVTLRAGADALDLQAGDGASVEGAEQLTIRASETTPVPAPARGAPGGAARPALAEVLLFDLA